MKYTFIGGPLDGVVEVTEREIMTEWVGPCPGRPRTHVVVYVLEAADKGAQERRYHYDWRTSNERNRAADQS